MNIELKALGMDNAYIVIVLLSHFHLIIISVIIIK